MWETVIKRWSWGSTSSTWPGARTPSPQRRLCRLPLSQNPENLLQLLIWLIDWFLFFTAAHWLSDGTTNPLELEVGSFTLIVFNFHCVPLSNSQFSLSFGFTITVFHYHSVSLSLYSTFTLTLTMFQIHCVSLSLCSTFIFTLSELNCVSH